MEDRWACFISITIADPSCTHVMCFFLAFNCALTDCLFIRLGSSNLSFGAATYWNQFFKKNQQQLKFCDIINKRSLPHIASPLCKLHSLLRFPCSWNSRNKNFPFSFLPHSTVRIIQLERKWYFPLLSESLGSFVVIKSGEGKRNEEKTTKFLLRSRTWYFNHIKDT